MQTNTRMQETAAALRLKRTSLEVGTSRGIAVRQIGVGASGPDVTSRRALNFPAAPLCLCIESQAHESGWPKRAGMLAPKGELVIALRERREAVAPNQGVTVGRDRHRTVFWSRACVHGVATLACGPKGAAAVLHRTPEPMVIGLGVTARRDGTEFFERTKRGLTVSSQARDQAMRAGHVRETPGIAHRRSTRRGSNLRLARVLGDFARGITLTQPGTTSLPRPTCDAAAGFAASRPNAQR